MLMVTLSTPYAPCFSMVVGMRDEGMGRGGKNTYLLQSAKQMKTGIRCMGLQLRFGVERVGSNVAECD